AEEDVSAVGETNYSCRSSVCLTTWRHKNLLCEGMICIEHMILRKMRKGVRKVIEKGKREKGQGAALSPEPKAHLRDESRDSSNRHNLEIGSYLRVRTYLKDTPISTILHG